MKIVIDINEHLYKTIKTLGLVVEDGDAVAVSEAILNGTPLEAQPTDAVSRSELLRHQHIIYDDDGEGYNAVYVKDIKASPSVQPQPCEDAMFFKIIKDIEESDEQQVSYNEEFQLSKYAYVINNAETFKERGYQVINEESVFGFDTVYLKRNKKVQPQPCEDAVSKEYIIEHLNICSLEGGRPYWTTSEIIDFIKELPFVQPQRKQGHWMKISKIGLAFKCSECESIEVKDSLFCPNCGSYMGGDSDDNS